MKIGIFLGGKSREREVSFAGGRTVFDCLDKQIFEPVPVFIDSKGNFIKLNWQFLYKGTIRDFYPPSEYTDSPNAFQLYIENLNQMSDEDYNRAIASVGEKVNIEELKNLIDFAFLCLHGPFGEDGSIQGMLEFLEIPYTSAGVLPSAIGVDKVIQKRLMQNAGFKSLPYESISRENWDKITDHSVFFEKLLKLTGLPLVVKAASQGSSIGVSILKENDLSAFKEAVNRSFFRYELDIQQWKNLDHEAKVSFIQELSDIDAGIGLPIRLGRAEIIHNPDQLLDQINKLTENKSENKFILLESTQTEPEVIFEPFISGKEFSCIVIQDENAKPLALPPTEIIKASGIFDYRAKYLPGISRKVTPINLADDAIQKIRQECEKLFSLMNSNVYARIDGFYTESGEVFLNDPNTTSGMLPSSFFFHQAAEIGLAPTQFLTYIIHTSLRERMRRGFNALKLEPLYHQLDKQVVKLKNQEQKPLKVAVILGGYSTERHISVESGRNVFEKLSASSQYQAVPVFLSAAKEGFKLHIIPVSLLLKDNADDIADSIANYKRKAVVDKIIHEAEGITKRFALPDYKFEPEEITITELKKIADFAFVALHGKPGEDGTLGKLLEAEGIAYNGSSPEAASLTIDKYKTNKFLRSKGFLTADHYLVNKDEWQKNSRKILTSLAEKINFPLIAKPHDDGCSSAVKLISDSKAYQAYADATFRDVEVIPVHLQKSLKLKSAEAFPKNTAFLTESLTKAEDADHFLEITGGMLTHYDKNGQLSYEVFEPSESIAGESILSLEEKFLAGEGQNITPARFHKNPSKNREISETVKQVFEKVAKATGITGYCRIDAFVRVYNDKAPEVIIIEINSLPGLTPATCIFHQAAINGYKPIDFLDRIINFGLSKLKQSN